jgi:hypothetical protein
MVKQLRQRYLLDGDKLTLHQHYQKAKPLEVTEGLEALCG